ncbi:MAG: hypothetical protein H7177_06310 [Rhizobacter sp.]|nr:hypothetical protein [Bacteriovorax sp.]
MNSIYKVFAFLLITNLVSCASHSTMRGSVAMKISDTEAHVCLGNTEVKVGDIINAYKNVCSNLSSNVINKNSRASELAPCKKVKIGSGKITSLINDHYSVVKFDNVVDFNEGTIIEKQ